MKNAVIFHQHFYYDESSPTKFRKRKTGKPAGTKRTYNDGHQHYALRCKVGKKNYDWSLNRCLFEIYHDVELPYSLLVTTIDNDVDNIQINNLIAVSCSAIQLEQNT
ncbi:TPA: hypothetical protein RFV54_003715 [Klebsiella aerogenes]|nr:hypothetical protein [Klebsiella aerogenes]